MTSRNILIHDLSVEIVYPACLHDMVCSSVFSNHQTGRPGNITVRFRIESEGNRYLLWQESRKISSRQSSEAIILDLEYRILEVAVQNLPRFMFVHSAVMVKGNSAIIFPAASGVGKTTLSLFLMEQGFTVLSDGAAMIYKETRRLYKFQRNMSVKETSPYFYKFEQKPLYPVETDTGNVSAKLIAPTFVDDFENGLRISVIAFLNRTDTDTATIASMGSASSLERFMTLSFHYPEFDEYSFHSVVDLVNKAEVKEIRFNDLMTSQSEIKELMMQLGENND